MLRICFSVLLLVLLPLEARASCSDAYLRVLRRERAPSAEFEPKRFAELKAGYSKQIEAGESVEAPREPLEKVAFFDAIRDSIYRDRDLAQALREASPRERKKIIRKISGLDFEEGWTEEQGKKTLEQLAEFVYGKPVTYRNLHIGLKDPKWWGETERKILGKKIDLELRSQPVVEAFRSQGMIRDPKALERIREKLNTSYGVLGRTFGIITAASMVIQGHFMAPAKIQVLRRIKITPELRQKIIAEGFEPYEEEIRKKYGTTARIDLFLEWARKVYVAGLSAYVVKETAPYAISEYIEWRDRHEGQGELNDRLIKGFAKVYKLSTGEELTPEQIELFKRLVGQSQ